MKLFQWMEKKGHPDTWLSQQLGISKPAVSGYRTGKTVPSLENAVKINRLTKGEVGFEDMLINPVSTVNQNELEDL
jgi:DNA-binding transcriptional regulator YdaS (Cro superfamily)